MEECKTLLFQYLSKRSQRDKDLSGEDAEVIQEAATRMTASDGDNAMVVNFASVLADIGDEIDILHLEAIKELMTLTTGTSETASEIFSSIVKDAFEWDSETGAKFNCGKIAALMSYCYHLIKTFIMEKRASGDDIFSFMCLMADLLFKAFIRVGFYDWLRNQGGWGQLLISASNSFSNMNCNVCLLVGVVSLASLAMWAISYFRRT